MITRGDIFYINKFPTYGSEQHPGRPAVIVSNDSCNAHSPVVEVVYLTCQKKKPLPTHVPITSTGVDSTALCEQISPVDIDRVGDLIGHLTDDEMRAVDQALMISLGLNIESPSTLLPSLSPEEESVMARVALQYIEDYVSRYSCQLKMLAQNERKGN